MGAFVGHNRPDFIIERIVDEEISLERKDQGEKEKGEGEGAWFHKIGFERWALL